jgi:hypothetical protein
MVLEHRPCAFLLLGQDGTTRRKAMLETTFIGPWTEADGQPGCTGSHPLVTKANFSALAESPHICFEVNDVSV